MRRRKHEAIQAGAFRIAAKTFMVLDAVGETYDAEHVALVLAGDKRDDQLLDRIRLAAICVRSARDEREGREREAIMRQAEAALTYARPVDGDA